MPEALAYCGLVCASCPIHLATLESDNAEQARMRAEIVRLCQEHYGVAYTREDIGDCDGCRSEGGRLFSSSRDCTIRNCARQKGLANCAHCDEYPCAKLEAFFATEPAAKARLDEMKRAL